MRKLFFVVSILIVTQSAQAGFWSSRGSSATKPAGNNLFGVVVEKNLDGLEADPQRATTMLFVKELPAAHSRGQALAGLAKTCAKSEYKSFCEKIDVTPKARSSAARTPSRRAVALNLKNLPALNEMSLMEVTRLLGKTKPEKAMPFAQEVLAVKECPSTALLTAMGAHLEDKFPQPEYVNATLALYERSMSCGKDEPAIRAAYRLGLLRIWRGQCSEAVKGLKAVTPDKNWSSLHSRAQYLEGVCTSKERLPASVAKEQVFEKFSQYPMSFHSIMFSLQQEDELFKTVKTQTDPIIWFRSLKDNRGVNEVVSVVEAALREDKFEYAKYWMEFTDPEKTADLEPEFRLYTGLLYHKTQLSLHKFRVFSRLFSDDIKYKSIATMKVMYPLWKFDIVDSATTTTDPLLVLSLIRQESAFQENAQSRVGARGLMQIMPKTAKSLHGKKLKPNDLYNPELNVRLGTKYVDKLLKKYDGNVYRVLAAYNAGGLRVDEWNKRYPTNNDVLFMDMIPYRETREYVASILRNYYWYSRLYPDLSKKQVVFWNQPSVLTN